MSNTDKKVNHSKTQTKRIKTQSIVQCCHIENGSKTNLKKFKEKITRKVLKKLKIRGAYRHRNERETKHKKVAISGRP